MKKNAFTLIELLIVVSIIGVLSAIGLIVYNGAQSKARDSLRKNNLNQLSLALEGYFQKYGKFVPPADTGIDTCIRDTDKFYKEIAPFIKDGKVPTDPKDNTNYCYVAIDKGQSFRLFAKVENCSDEKVITGLDCSKLTYKYSVTSDDLTPAPSLDDSIAASPGTVNLLANAGFEDGLNNWNWWTVSGGSGSANINGIIAHSGTKSASLDYSQTCRCNPPGGLIEGVYLAQTFARKVQTDQNYAISFWARHGPDTSSGNTINAHVYVTERGQTPQLTSLVSFFNVGMTWTQFSSSFTVPSNWAGKDLQIVLVEPDTRVGMSILYDDISVTPAPTGASPPPEPVAATCQDGTTEQSYINPSMVRCDGSVTYNQASSLCKQGTAHVCSLQEYLTRGGDSFPISVSDGKLWWLTTSGKEVGQCGGFNNPWLEIRPDSYFRAFGAEGFYRSALKDNLPNLPRAPFCGTEEWILGYFYPQDKSRISEGTMCCSGTQSNPTPTPSPSIKPQSTAYRRVFVTSTTNNGSLGGLTGADAKCQARADSVSLGGTWKSWLSDSQTSATTRISHSQMPYVLINGTEIAKDWNDLTDGTLEHSINVTELNTTQSSGPWANTSINGSACFATNPNASCSNWTSSSATGMTGRATDTGQSWTCYDAPGCSESHPIYCFEQ